MSALSNIPSLNDDIVLEIARHAHLAGDKGTLYSLLFLSPHLTGHIRRLLYQNVLGRICAHIEGNIVGDDACNGFIKTITGNQQLGSHVQEYKIEVFDFPKREEAERVVGALVCMPNLKTFNYMENVLNYPFEDDGVEAMYQRSLTGHDLTLVNVGEMQEMVLKTLTQSSTIKLTSFSWDTYMDLDPFNDFGHTGVIEYLRTQPGITHLSLIRDESEDHMERDTIEEWTLGHGAGQWCPNLTYLRGSWNTVRRIMPRHQEIKTLVIESGGHEVEADHLIVAAQLEEQDLMDVWKGLETVRLLDYPGECERCLLGHDQFVEFVVQHCPLLKVLQLRCLAMEYLLPETLPLSWVSRQRHLEEVSIYILPQYDGDDFVPTSLEEEQLIAHAYFDACPSLRLVEFVCFFGRYTNSYQRP
ncbi:hypothetical protein BJ165DRAFT_1532392 [Panaeolus papilionaceus]|nr:hypothetical protein BJ165DRAFT_1532392 [Panaeolus papilionaceus]